MLTALGFTIFLTGVLPRICGFALRVRSLLAAAFVEVIFRQPKRVAETILTPRLHHQADWCSLRVEPSIEDARSLLECLLGNITKFHNSRSSL